MAICSASGTCGEEVTWRRGEHLHAGNLLSVGHRWGWEGRPERRREKIDEDGAELFDNRAHALCKGSLLLEGIHWVEVERG